eukprot:CAMPEP_0206491522 /NCGR_PEP_ID=MMETSP0324_2-20121206/45089_1 /ASSEMBLY_ACC=CAM_ASM_000836 /TAXON_ID=2866 /ORGANISM="Crypthecodinium cohnii, Strain Seligo" /LENGTH=89 /DNA_ID=CAMNT_0053972815 /DNA_START=26 /DNA_END=292 /DNA_ORIENTATION=-
MMKTGAFTDADGGVDGEGTGLHLHFVQLPGHPTARARASPIHSFTLAVDPSSPTSTPNEGVMTEEEKEKRRVPVAQSYFGALELSLLQR